MPPIIHTDKCSACGTCARICCMDVFGPTAPGAIPVVRYPEECWHCRACIMDCPSGAIEMRYPLPYTLLWKDAPGSEGDPQYPDHPQNSARRKPYDISSTGNQNL